MFLSATSGTVRFFYNRGEAGQWAPTVPSPEVSEVDVATGRKLFTLAACPDAGGANEACASGADIDIVAHAAWIDDTFGPRHPEVALVSRRGGTVLDVGPFTSYDPYTLVRRAPGVHVLDVYQGPAGPYGSGPSGGMTGSRFEIVTMDGAGRFALLEPPFELGLWRDHVVGTDALPGFEGQEGNADGTLQIEPKARVLRSGRGPSSLMGSEDASFESRMRARMRRATNGAGAERKVRPFRSRQTDAERRRGDGAMRPLRQPVQTL